MAHRQFQVHFCCLNCLQKSTTTVAVPRIEDAPYDVETFLGSAALEGIRFKCVRCEGSIGKILAVKMAADGEALAA